MDHGLCDAGLQGSMNGWTDQSINQGFFYSGLSNLNHCEVHYSARRKDCCNRNVFRWIDGWMDGWMN